MTAQATNVISIGWPIAAAIGLASLSIVGNVLLEIYKTAIQRWADRRAIAAALAGEIAGYLLNLNVEVTASNYRKIAGLDRAIRTRRLAAFPSLPSGHPAYDKLVDKIGLIPPDLIREISCFYNVITSMRLIIMNFRTLGFLESDDDFQRASIEHIANIMDSHIQTAHSIVTKLKKIAGNY